MNARNYWNILYSITNNSKELIFTKIFHKKVIIQYRQTTNTENIYKREEQVY